MIAKDPKNPARRLMLLSKCNIAPDGGGLAYSIVDAAIAWEPGPVEQSADEVLAQEQENNGPGRPSDERDEAEEFLRVELADLAEHPVGELRKSAVAAGIRWRTVERAKKDLGVIHHRATFGGGYVWRWPKPGKPDGDTRLARHNPKEGNSGEHGEHDELPTKRAD